MWVQETALMGLNMELVTRCCRHVACVFVHLPHSATLFSLCSLCVSLIGLGGRVVVVGFFK